MRFERWNILDGSTFELEAPTDSEFRFAWMDDAGASYETPVTAADGKVSWQPEAGARVYYVACRDDADSQWERRGEIEVETLVDVEEQTLIAELKDLQKRIREQEAFQPRITDPASGTSIERVDLVALRRERNRAENRLVEYRRVKLGKPPLRFV